MKPCAEMDLDVCILFSFYFLPFKNYLKIEELNPR